VRGACHDLHGVAAFQGIAKRNQLAVHLGAHAAVAELRVDGVGEIDGCCPLGQFPHVAVRREDVHLVREKVDLEDLHELLVVLEFLLPFDDRRSHAKILSSLD
jgi:hypothetical protein